MTCIVTSRVVGMTVPEVVFISSQVKTQRQVRSTVELVEATLADGSVLDDHFSAMGGWISSTLVRLGDLKLTYLPALEIEGGEE